MVQALISPGELDDRLCYPSGRSVRLARKGLIPHVVLPDGSIRFDPSRIEAWLSELAVSATPAATRLDEETQ